MPEGSMARRLREALLAAAAALIDLVDGNPDLPAAPVRVRVERNGTKVTYKATGCHGGPAATGPPDQSETIRAAFFTLLESQIVLYLSENHQRPQRSEEVVAHFRGQHARSRVKESCTSLRERGVLENNGAGYRVAATLFVELARAVSGPTRA
jgi:hypothetical protein